MVETAYNQSQAGARVHGALRHALQAWDGLLELLPVAVYVCDVHGAIVLYNRRAAEIWGRAPVAGDKQDRFCGSHRLYIGGREIVRDETPMAQVVRTGVPIHGAEGLLERPDGSLIWAMVHIDPIRDEQGRIVGAINCFHDTTTQKKTEQQLREEERRLFATYEHVTVGITELDAEGRRLRMNEEACRIAGVAREELIGGTVFDDQYRAENPADWEQFQRLVAGDIERYAIERPYTKKSTGEIIWITATSSAVRDDAGRFLYAVRVNDDITESKQLSDALVESEARLAATYEQATIGISEADAEGRLLRVNEASCLLTGYSREELLSRASFFQSMRPQDVDAERDLYRRQVSGQVDRYTIEKKIRRKDGSEIFVSVMSSSVRDRDGRFRYAVRVIQDITERKKAEVHLKTLIDELNHRVKNTLATVQSLSRQSARGAPSPELFQERFQGRLLALSEGHDQLTRGNWEQANLREVLASALAPYLDDASARVEIAGEAVEIPPRAALTLAMVFHELVTNAAKYGALSHPGGRLHVGWKVQPGGDTPALEIVWQESGGPAIAKPERTGFGTKMVERSIPAELGGTSSLQFGGAGVRCVIQFPLVKASERDSTETQRSARIRRRG